MKELLDLFLHFFKIGFFTFGGGWSILAQMEEEYINKRHLITKQELLDMTSVGKSLPGIMITNITVVFGYRMAGVAGAVAATLGIVIPPVLVLTGVTVVYNSVKDNVYVAYALKGIRACVIPIIASSAISLWKSAVTDRWCLLICLGAFLLSAFVGVGNVEIILGGLLLALLLMGKDRHKKKQ